DLRRPANVIAHEQVQVTIVVEIKPGRAGAPFLLVAGNPSVRSYVLEFAVPEILEEMVFAHSCDEDIHQAVVIEVAEGRGHAVNRHIQSRASGYILKISFAIILIKRCGGRLFAGRTFVRPISAVYEQEVLIAIVVEIKKADATA